MRGKEEMNELDTHVTPLTYDGKVIGYVYVPDGDMEKVTFRIITDEGKKIINDLMQSPIGISSRKIGSVLEDGTVDDSQPFIELLKNIPDNSN